MHVSKKQGAKPSLCVHQNVHLNSEGGREFIKGGECPLPPLQMTPDVSVQSLTCREREEDLEKKQFFINRELRPLMAIPGTLK